MPVFHTKTIEAILEPVAQQVSQLVILHEEAEAGSAMPDLSRPVMAVGAAVQNLIQVGRDTADSTKDKILKQEMPLALNRVETASKQLYDAAEVLKGDASSVTGRRNLIDGARGILGGTSDLLLTFDQSEVRKILMVAKGVLEYLAVAEVVEVMQDLVTFVKNLTPGMTNLSNKVTSRSKELTHVAHANGLMKHNDNLKRTAPILISSIKIFVTTLQKGGVGRVEAQKNRNYIIGRMSHDVNEIIRILQLTSAEEDDWSMDDLTVMKRSLLNISNQMDKAKQWLGDEKAEPGGLGEKAIRDILKDARKVADRLEGPEKQRLMATIQEIETMLDRLCTLRANGMGSSPEAVKLAREIDAKLQQLQHQVDTNVKRAVALGLTSPAFTLAGKVEQAQKWLRNPGQEGNRRVGMRAIAGIVAQGRKVAQNLTGPERAELLRLCDEVESLAQEVSEMAARGQGNSPQCLQKARELESKLPLLQKKIEVALVKEVADAFMDTTTPLKQLEKAAKAPIDEPNRDQTYTTKATVFLKHANKVSDTAKLVAEAGAKNEKQLVEELNSCAQEVRELAPQVVDAGKILLMNPGEQAAISHFDDMKKEYATKMDALTDLVDQATDTVEFVKASEEAIKKESETVDNAIKERNPDKIVENASNIARRAQRVAVVAGKEAANSEDPHFVQDVNRAVDQLTKDIPPTVVAAKNVALNPGSKNSQDEWFNANHKLVKSVAAVRIPLTVEIPAEQAPLPPPPPFYPEGGMERSATPQAHSRMLDDVPYQGPPGRGPPVPPPPPPHKSSLDETDYQPLGTTRHFQVGRGSAPKIKGGAPPGGQQYHQPASQHKSPSYNFPDELTDDLDAVLRSFPNFPSTPSGYQAQEQPTYAPRAPPAPQPKQSPKTAPKPPKQLQSDVVDVRKAVTVNQEPPLPPPPDMSQLHLQEAAPPRPPLPEGEIPPPRPPPPEDQALPIPEQDSDKPIMQAAYDLHVETQQWSSKDNDLIAAAKKMAQLMAMMSKHVSGEGGTKKDLIDTAKAIVKVAAEVTRLTREIANQCTDIRMRVNLLQVCERIPTISTQLKILSTVKAVMLLSQETEEDMEATEMLVGNAQNLMKAVKETVRAAKAASIKIRTDAGYKMRWVRQRPWYQ